MRRMDSEQINSWQTRCRQQGAKCEYCDNCTPELIRDRFIIGINDKTLRTTLVNRAVKEPRISLEKTVLHAQAYEATLVSTGTEEKPDHVLEQVNYTASSRSVKPMKKPVRNEVCPWCAGPSHRDGKAECPAQGRQCYACGKMDHLSIACKHPNPNWRPQNFQNRSQASGYRGRDNSARFKQQVRHVDIEHDFEDNFQYDQFSIDHAPTESVHTVCTVPPKPHYRELMEKMRNIRMAWKRS